MAEVRPIPCEDLGSLAAPELSAGKEVLAGQIAGLRVLLYEVTAGQTVRTSASESEGRVYIFVSGTGSIDGGDASHQISEITFFAPAHNVPFSVTTTAPSLRFLELIVELSETDLAELADNAAALPICLPYSECPTYRERIKSEKTVSRTLLAEHTFPRLCIGSVETTGDDRVAAHEHPMLEQLFYGLEDNDCLVRADDAELEFGEQHLLHIPLGSSHGVEVGAPRKLHYLWIDLFRDRKGMDWIVQEHLPEGE
ncbi:hypothetical protein ACFL6X_02920 [Candidatus Latescibacterota bacterium]